MFFGSNSTHFFVKIHDFFDPVYKTSLKIFEFDSVYERMIKKPYPEERHVPI